MALRGMASNSASSGSCTIGDPPPLFDRLQADRAISATAGKQDADAVGMDLGKGAKRDVNRSALPARLVKVGDFKVAVSNAEVLVGRDDVDVVRLHADALSHLPHGHGGVSLQHLRQRAFALG